MCRRTTVTVRRPLIRVPGKAPRIETEFRATGDIARLRNKHNGNKSRAVEPIRTRATDGPAAGEKLENYDTRDTVDRLRAGIARTEENPDEKHLSECPVPSLDASGDGPDFSDPANNAVAKAISHLTEEEE
ncbi:Hypothetical protein CINCED_3A006617 [Cinara cedri]|uniref:Uncharacterized protein n=1 Tax=Cinara cedri TaxID=506608 RepID=A0A5E4M4Q5_9HEMI|nr:Hypothetical protein CINCED_3A006617 [Cinara cedri]